MNKVVLITGSGAGIGLMTAQMFRERGYIVYASARCHDTVTMLRSRGFDAVQLDVTDDNSMSEVVDQIQQRHHAVDILVNNAGYSLPGPVEELSMSDLRHVFETNVFGMVRMCQLVLPAMRHKGAGRIINIGSVGGLFTTPGSTAYHMTKYAVESLSDGLRAEVVGFGVDVVLIEPGGVATNFVYTANKKMPRDIEGGPYTVFKNNIISGSERMFEASAARWGIVQPEHVAQTIIRAAEAPQPHTRYKVGRLAHVLPRILGLMTDRQADRMWLRQFPLT